MKRRVGFSGKKNIPVGVAFEGVLHLEHEPMSFRSLCNRRLEMMADPDNLLADKDRSSKTLIICKRCRAKETS